MSALLTLPAKTMGARPVRWSVEKFHQAREANQLEGERTFLLRGVLMEQGPMNPPHAMTCEFVQSALQAVFTSGWRIRCQLPLVLGQSTDPMPDFAVIRGNLRESTLTHPRTAELVVEVSDTTIDIDTGDKAELYAAAGIADYCVVDVSARTVIVHRDPDVKGERYRAVNTFGESEMVAPLVMPDGKITVRDLLP